MRGAADLAYEGKKGRTGRELFLEKMEEDDTVGEAVGADQVLLLPQWREGERALPAGGAAAGHCVQLCYNVSDPGMEDLLYEAESVRRFSGIRLEKVPDERRSSTSAIAWSVMDWARCCLPTPRGIGQSKV